MKEIIKELLKNITEIFKVKNLITLVLTIVLVLMLTGQFTPNQEFVTVFCTAYGSIITHFFVDK